VAGAALIACATLAAGGAVGSAWLAQLTFIGFAGFRLLPAGQQMYHAFVVIRANRATLENLASQLEHRTAARAEPAGTAATPMPFRSIGLSGVSFRYSPETPWVLADVSLRIGAGAAVGIVGPSGCGKTTLVDLLVGLMLPTSGRIEIDGEALDPQRVETWQQAIGYVPQEVMILDATVRENIAFGVDPAGIDDERVRAAAKQAGAAAFIESLPGGFLARTSGVGGSLSGGQRQRLGIARALYRNPSLLVLDEATNSLDADTERAIIDTVVRNRGSRTLVIVAHGDSVIGACDLVYELRDGRLHERGSSTARLRWGVE
jgi:ABC-type bacteriocin/lantibiotic exporter with double-glycine peptidase domain